MSGMYACGLGSGSDRREANKTEWDAHWLLKRRDGTAVDPKPTLPVLRADVVKRLYSRW